MSKNKKSGSKTPMQLESIVFATALLNLIEAIIELIKKLLE